MTSVYISERVGACLKGFKDLITEYNSYDSDKESERVSDIQDELSRFRVWTGNIGAHQTGRSSLQYRLRDASHLTSQVLRLLDSLHEMLQDACSISQGIKVPWTQAYQKQNLSSFFAILADAVNCLLRLSVSIKNPAPHDRFRRSHLTATAHYEPYDIQHVREKFSGGEERISERLGKAISRRRQYFKYREMRHAAMSHGLDSEDSKTEANYMSTVASSIPENLKSTDIFALQNDEGSEAGLSLTSYPSSVRSSDRLRIPPCPSRSNNEPFQCPYCYMMIIVNSEIAWKRHVFQDLRPYICLNKDCETPQQDFERRHHWMKHLTQYHWKVWHCTEGCETTFSSARSYKAHLTTVHPRAFPATELESIVQLGGRRVDPDNGIECPICCVLLKSTKEYEKHVGDHQEQLALFALPKIGEDDISEEHSIQLAADKEGILQMYMNISPLHGLPTR
ncbi:hypothetical protein F5B22DRAFT_637527 [Xylaria bambusicola]|uniref:uncharacterized protein n=1 Tax=Xylaria bambusicola TaxID=326684 RepID=UPI002007D3D7|nr:uncharacterized protein F5B22DRAFT_637527 [Xylaria bambusicola]KAI0512938.1 hypothetical protein F5B22DRAFT_637527 [Xylaria bambusicola]